MVVTARMVVATALVPGAEGRLGQVLGRRLQFGRVLLHPRQEMEFLEGVGQPAVTLLDLVDHGGQPPGHVGEGVHQRVAEQSEEPQKDEQRHHHDDAHRAPPPEAVALEEVDGRIEHQGDEGGDQDPQDHLPQPTEQPVRAPRWR
jgi:hypothetical protein